MSKKKRLAGTLTRRNRSLESYLGGLGFDESIIVNSVQFGNGLEADAHEWIERNGLFSGGRIDKRRAESMWRSEFSKEGAL
ncbi:hypothetical protein [Altererythrobacter sp. GH1-8]|uniref:hypothetical protein n=1 Tax=Altererythrobacter sp. GH1-8 TaxID=3349333 RepID=UPI00374CBC27